MSGYLLRKAQRQAADFPHGNPSLHRKAELEDELAGLRRLEQRLDVKCRIAAVTKLLAETPWPTTTVAACPDCLEHIERGDLSAIGDCSRCGGQGTVEVSVEGEAVPA